MDLYLRIRPERNLVIAVLFASLVCWQAAAASPLLQNLATDAYETIGDHQREGQWLIVMVWAHDCEICEREVGDYQRYHQNGAGGNASVVGVTLDGEHYKKQALDFVRRHQLSFTNLIGEPETVAGYYEIVTGSRWIGTPSFLIFGPDGELKAKQVGAVEVEIVENFIASQ
jgi:peroxiredoxin